ncbi:MAG: LTA synthase family protein, partial [Nevskiaceae bacterium]
EGAGNAYAEEISGNGLFTLAAALRRNELDFDRFYRTMPQSEADRILRTMGMQRRPLSDLSAQALKGAANHAWPFIRRPRNVVLISAESLSASFLGAYGDSRGLTPRLDAIAKQGLLFSHAYATGTRTVRGVEALSLGTPPVPGQAIVRRPQNEHLATLGEVLGSQGFKPYFFYGGYGYFDNMNAYFGGNGYKVIDRTDMAHMRGCTSPPGLMTDGL